MKKLRKMTIGEAADVAGVPKETLRSRIHNGLVEARNTPGWARFEVPEVAHIAIHAELIRRLGISSVAWQVANWVSDTLADACSYPPHCIRRKGQLSDAFLIFRRTNDGFWHMRWADGRDVAAHEAGRHLHDSTFVEASSFVVVNATTLTDWALDRIFDAQGIEGNEAEAPA